MLVTENRYAPVYSVRGHKFNFLVFCPNCSFFNQYSTCNHTAEEPEHSGTTTIPAMHGCLKPQLCICIWQSCAQSLLSMVHHSACVTS